MYFTTKQNVQVLVDEDFSDTKGWYLLNGYVARVTNGKIEYLHRLVNDTPADKFTDHVNRNKLDNRKANLRTVDNSLSQYNQNKRTGKSGVRGVGEHMGRWRAMIGVNRKQVYLGHYDTKEQAVEARQKAEAKYYK